MAHVLVVDDELSMREFLGILLRKAGHRVSATGDGQVALDLVAKDAPEVVIQDLKMPGMSGVELLQKLKAKDPQLPVIVITAFSTWDNTVEAMRLGAYDYVKKPFNNDEIREVVERALAHRTHAVKASDRAELPELRELVGNSTAMREALDIARRVAPTEATVLLEGESGTGKELFARLVHHVSDRGSAPFVGVNCGALPEALLESELFGHMRGSFTGAYADKRGLLQLANGGSFFLDEVGELPLGMQVRFLRVLEERQFFPVGGTKPVRIDVRFICATNRDLADEVRRGRFRGDLFFRLNVVPIRLPPLRERQGDVPLLAGYFVRKYARILGREIVGIAPAAQAKLERYGWPGNVRELENAIQRAIALARGNVIEDVHLAAALLAPMAPGGVALPGPAAAPASPPHFERSGFSVEPSEARFPGDSTPAGGIDLGGDGALAVLDPGTTLPTLPPIPEGGLDLEAMLAAIERKLIESALARTDGNLTRAADLLKISFRSLRYKVKKLGIRA